MEDVLRADKEQHGIEQNFGFLKDSLVVNSLFLKKPERIEALGLVLLLALLLWWLMERSLRIHMETAGNTFHGRDRAQERPPTSARSGAGGGSTVVSDRFDAVAEVVKSVSEGANRVQEYRFRPTGPEHRELFDGPE